jgi:hypothetical protein
MGEIEVVDPDIKKGLELLTALDDVDLSPRAALWLVEEDIWRLVLQIPKLENESTSRAYKKIQAVTIKAPDSFPELASIMLVKQNFPLLEALRSAFSVPPGVGNLRYRISKSSFNGLFVEDAYIYRL